MNEYGCYPADRDGREYCDDCIEPFEIDDDVVVFERGKYHTKCFKRLFAEELSQLDGELTFCDKLDVLGALIMPAYF